MSWTKRGGPNGPGGRAAGAKGLKPGEKVSPVQPEDGRERESRGRLGQEGPGICALSQGQWEVIKAMTLLKPFEDFSGCCVDRELVDGRLGSGKCLDGGEEQRWWPRSGAP